MSTTKTPYLKQIGADMYVVLEETQYGFLAVKVTDLQNMASQIFADTQDTLGYQKYLAGLKQLGVI